MIFTAEKSKLTSCTFIVQKFMENENSHMIELIKSSPHQDKQKLHHKLYYHMINNCMDKITIEDVFEVFFLIFN